QAEFIREATSLGGDVGLDDVRFGMTRTQEVEAHPWPDQADLVDGPDERRRVEPVIEPASPDHDVVVGPDARHDSAQGGSCPDRRVVGKAEGYDVEETAERGVVPVGAGIDPSQGGQKPQPQVSLLVTGADEEVPTGQLFLEGTNRVGDVDRALRLLVVTGEHERLEMERVIEVEDHDLARNAELGNVVKEIALHDGDVTPTLELLEPRPVCGLHRELP